MRIESEGTLDDLYFEWLYSRIWAVRNRNPARSYWKLAKQLYSTPFVWFIPNDDNRVIDGQDLRNEFLNDKGIEADEAWLGLDCSFMELLIALSRRLEFETEQPAADWFWRLLENLELQKYTDSKIRPSTHDHIACVLHKINERLYSESGQGGLFPLEHPKSDQRRVEIWYQMHAYLLEGNDVNG